MIRLAPGGWSEDMALYGYWKGELHAGRATCCGVQGC